jgi:hypothetical protein
MLDSKKNLKILYIVIGQPRGTDLAWKSLHKYVLSKMNAHLATFFTKKYPQTTILHQMAQFNWNAEEYDDWGIVFDRAAKTCSPDSAAADWRQLCKIPDQWLGSIKNCGHPASAGILWSFRWLVQQKLALLNLEDKYDVFILSRADELFLCDHYNFSQFNKSVGYLPEGEEYGGYSDRHLAGNFDIWNKMINITKNIVCNPEKMRESLFKWKPGSGFNMESVQKAMWDEWGLEITSFPRTMFTVRGPEDPTQWSTGEAHEILSKFKLKVKYQGEMDATLRNCNSDLKKTLDDIDSHEWYKYFPIQ